MYKKVYDLLTPSFKLFLVPIRSCLEYKRRCHANVDGVYTIINMQGDETLAYCDMTKDGGGWTLLVTSRSKTGWDDKTVLLRYEI